MWSLVRPIQSAENTFATCISRVQDHHLATRLAAAAPAVVAASEQFDREAQRSHLHMIAAHNIVAPDVTCKEMEAVYTQRMVKSSSPGRFIYDEIFTSSPAGKCPLCMQRSVTTLDHHLPKAQFPSLAVAPLNLIPACSDCNKAKQASHPRAEEEAPLHPYYDDLGSDVWLSADVVESQPAALKFRVNQPVGWSDILAARVGKHFRSLGLAKLFTAEAGEELVNIRHQLTLLRSVDAVNAVKMELRRRADSCEAVRPNGWRAASYRAWSASDWFCQGGFQSAG